MAAEPLRTLTDLLAACGVGDGPHGHSLASLENEHRMLPRLEFLQLLKSQGVEKLGDRQKLANALGKARREGRLLPALDDIVSAAPAQEAALPRPPRQGVGEVRGDAPTS